LLYLSVFLQGYVLGLLQKPSLRVLVRGHQTVIAGLTRNLLV
jgi:hypothetical protein